MYTKKEFRIWDKKKKTMHRVIKMALGASWIINDKLSTFNNEDCILLQYTGREDKNNFKIFEGDLFNHPLLAHQIEITFDQVFSCEMDGIDLSLGEVVGNVYNNKK